MADLLALCADLPVTSLAPDEVLIESGVVGEAMFVLVSGAVTVERDGVAFARVDNPGAVFGEMAVVLERPATATVRASTATEVHVITDPHAFLTERPGAALEVLRTTAARLDGLTRYLVDVKAQLADEVGHAGMVGELVDALVHHQAPPVRHRSARDPEG